MVDRGVHLGFLSPAITLLHGWGARQGLYALAAGPPEALRPSDWLALGALWLGMVSTVNVLTLGLTASRWTPSVCRC